MAAPTVIKWTDSGVPVLTRVASNLIAILDFCLPQRGWIKEFSDVDKAVYRAGTGERKFYRILNDATVNATTYTYARITGYDSMSTVDTGAGWAASQTIMLSQSTNVSRPWICIFDEKTVLLITMPGALTSSTIANCSSVLHGFGETLPGLPGQTARNFMGCQPTMGDWYDTSAIHRLNTAGLLVNRSIDGTRLAISAKLKRNGGDPGDNVGNSLPMGNWSYCVLSYPYNGELLYGRPMIDDALDYSMGDYIPGLYYPCQKGNGFNNAETYTSGSKSLVAFLISGQASMFTSKPTTNLTYYGAVLIDLGDWG